MKTGLRRLHYFLALAEELNFNRAAVRLGITQPALSRAVTLLEDELGLRLFERSNRHVRLSLAGESFVDGCRIALGSLDGAIAKARQVADGRAGELTVGYTDTAIAGRLPDIIQSFRLAFPDVRVRLRQAYSRQQRQWLDEGVIDMAFMTGPYRGPGRDAVTVQRDRYAAILPKGHALARAGTLRLADLAPYPFVMGDPVAWVVYNERFLGLCAAAGFVPDVVQSAPDSRGIIGLVSCGMGVSVQPESLANQGDRRARFRFVDDCAETVTTQAVWHVGGPEAAKARLIEHVRSFEV